MKKIAKIILSLSFLVVFNTYSYSAEFKIFDIRNKIFDESKQVKAAIPKARDFILLTSMFDSCIYTMSQIDAYFTLVGLFDSIKKEDMTNSSLNFLLNWLTEMKKSNDVSIKSLESMQTIEASTKAHAEKIKGYLGELNKQIDNEISKVSLISKSLKVQQKKVNR